jgi:hypothetical protein
MGSKFRLVDVSSLARAVYVDFEGNVGQPLTLVGALHDASSPRFPSAIDLGAALEQSRHVA